MADQRITDLATLTGSVAASGDLALVVDVSDTSMAATGTDKKMTLAELATAITTIGSLATDSEVTSAISALSATYQPLDSDLTAIAALSTTAFGRGFLVLADAAAGRTTLGLGTAATADTGTGASNVPTITQADARYQPLDSDLTAIAALTTTAFGRALLELADAAAGRTALGLGSLATASTITSADITDGTIVNGDISASAAIALSKLATDPLARANHTGTQAASTISDFAEVARDTIGSALVAGSNITITVDDPNDTITIAATGGGGATNTRPSNITGAATYWATPSGDAMTAAETSLNASVQYLYYGPTWLCTAAYRITDAQVEVTTALANSNGRLGLVEIDPVDDQPSALVADFGTVSTASTGIKAITGLSVSLTAGKRYASVFVRDATGGGNAQLRAYPVPYGHMGMDPTFTNRAIVSRYKTGQGTQYSSGFSNPPTDWDTIDAGANAHPGSYEFMLVKKAAV